MAASRRAAFGFILATIFLEALSFGLIFPVLPRLVLQLEGGDDAAAARAFGIIAAAWAAANFFAAPVLGALSDRFGRRPVLVASAFGFAADLVVMAVAPNLVWLFLGRLISGFTAGNFATASAYLADITAPGQRAARFGVFAAVYGAGMILGPAAGGVLGEISPRAPFWVAAGVAGLMALYGFFVLPESLPPDKRGEVRTINPFAAFGILRTPGLPKLAVIMTLVALGGTSANTLFVLYVDHRYGWDAAAAGLLLTVFAAGNILVMGVIAPLAAKRAGEQAALIAGLALCAVGFAGLALASTGLLFALACIPMCLGNLCGPPLRALQTNLVDATQQGRLQGALGGLQALAALVGPLAFTQVYAQTLSQPGGFSGGALLVGSLLMAVATLIAFTIGDRPKAA
ncbi:MAG: MFS transporter [Phenylobacterium sp.]|uniref:MFS transporter n=1 Tax=Phenylobacterium sp. TaxID=1871053 RepID=UPI001A3C8542|nr:MFS transporter [Phenylobacterium sp.]MBL8553196.1 MFS transporter [Phenylobacterium sp.]